MKNEIARQEWIVLSLFSYNNYLCTQKFPWLQNNSTAVCKWALKCVMWCKFPFIPHSAGSAHIIIVVVNKISSWNLEKKYIIFRRCVLHMIISAGTKQRYMLGRKLKDTVKSWNNNKSQHNNRLFYEAVMELSIEITYTVITISLINNGKFSLVLTRPYRNSRFHCTTAETRKIATL